MEHVSVLLNGMPMLLKGLLVTLELGIGFISLGLIIGLILASGQVYGNRFLGWFCSGVVQVFRGIPAVPLLFLFYFGLGQLGVNFSAVGAALLAMGLRSGAYQSEVFRGAIQSVRSGQVLAVQALGMNLFKTIRYVIFPQALRYSLAPWSNEFAAQIKDVSLCYAIGVAEIMRQGRYIVTHTFGNAMLIYCTIALIYLGVVYSGLWLLRRWEARLRVPGFDTE
jgi:polar amino acid transport system permease protein